MISVIVFVSFIVLVIYPVSAADDSCDNFTTRTVYNDTYATLRFSLPEACTSSGENLTLVVVSARNQASGEIPEDLCQISPSHWLLATVSQCIWDGKTQMYSVTRRVRGGLAKWTSVEVSMTAELEGRPHVKSTVMLQLPELTVSQTTLTSTSLTFVKTTLKPERGDRDPPAQNTRPASVGPPKDKTPEGTDGVPARPTKTGTDITNNVDTSDKDESVNQGTSEDNPSFVQTPAFGFVLMGVVMAIILMLLVFLLLKTKANWLPVVRRVRNSMVIPDNYEHPTGSHHYERPTFRGRQLQPSAPRPPPPPPSNPADNRDSLPGHYFLIDDAMVGSGGYEIPDITGGASQFQTEL